MLLRFALPFACLLALPAALAQSGPEQTVGTKYHLKIEDLAKPFATPSQARGAQRISRPTDATLRVPPGFRANVFRDGLTGPRWLTVAANGDVILAETWNDEVKILRDGDGDGRAEFMSTFSDDMESPHGLALHGGYLYVSNPVTVVRYAYAPGQTKRSGPAERVTRPGALGDGSGHSTRNLAISPDGKHLYVAVGSRGNVAEEELPRATVQRFDLDGGGQTTFATGLRNAVGIEFHPESGKLFVTVNERDGYGDGLVPDFLTEVRQGAFYGWPYAYLGPIPDPQLGDRRPDLVAKTVTPDVLFQSHSAPLGLTFYTGGMFPADYRGDAFVAFHGSWNAAKPRGYKIVRVPFEDGKPRGGYENFATGFWHAGASPAQVWGRPAGLAVAKDGSLLIADDSGGAIWRISYRAP